MSGVIPDWMREEQRVQALLGDQANVSPETQAAQSAVNYAPTGVTSPYLDPSSGRVVSPYDYFNKNNIQAQQTYNAQMQEALNRGDNQGYEQALNAYRQATGGLQPVWSYNITQQSVASNAPHPNDPWNVAWNATNNPTANQPTNPGTVGGSPNVGSGNAAGGRGSTGGTTTGGGRTDGSRGARPDTSGATTGPTGGQEQIYNPPAGTPGGGAIPMNSYAQQMSNLTTSGNPSGQQTPAGPSSPAYTGGGGLPTYNGGANSTASSYQLPGYNAPYQAPQFNPNAGLDPLYYGYQQGAAGNPALSYIPDLTTNDPNRLYRNVQNVSYNYGAGNAAQLANDVNEQSRLYGQFGGAANDAYARLNETPGYTQDEAGNIIREGDYRSGVTSDAGYASLGPTSAETAGMLGDTASYANYFDPERFNNINQTNKNMQYANLDRSQGAQDSALNSLSHSYDTSIDPSKLRIDGEYARQAGMTDAEVERMANAGARNVGLATQAQTQEMVRRAAANGQTSALALGALQNRMNQTGLVNAADARVNAELAARDAQRKAATGVEQTRLSAEQGLTGYQTAAARDLANQKIAASQYQAGLTNSTQNQLAGNELNSQQYITNTGINLAKSQDEANAARQAQLYGIRQANTQYGQQSKYNQNMGVNQALSTNYANVAQQRIAGQDKYRGYLTGQQSQALGAKQTAQGQNLQNYNAMTGAMNSNAGMWGNYQLGKSSLPAGWQQIISGIANGAASATQQAQF